MYFSSHVAYYVLVLVSSNSKKASLLKIEVYLLPTFERRAKAFFARNGLRVDRSFQSLRGERPYLLKFLESFPGDNSSPVLVVAWNSSITNACCASDGSFAVCCAAQCGPFQRERPCLQTAKVFGRFLDTKAYDCPSFAAECTDPSITIVCYAPDASFAVYCAPQCGPSVGHNPATDTLIFLDNFEQQSSRFPPLSCRMHRPQHPERLLRPGRLLCHLLRGSVRTVQRKQPHLRTVWR